MYEKYFTRLRSATQHVIIPKNFCGLDEVANLAEQAQYEFSSAFWNTPARKDIPDNAKYIAMVLSILKKRAGRRGADKALEIINLIEERNVRN